MTTTIAHPRGGQTKKGKLFVVSAPSGTGKTTLCERLISTMQDRGRLVRSISVTTRKRRRGEKNGRDYFFISPQDFRRRRKAQQFLEWAKVLGNFYGTPRQFVEKNIARGWDVLLSIDVQGAHKIRRKLKNTIFIFILPPSMQELKTRLKRRSTENKEELHQRLKLAKKEITFLKEYDYVVVNDKISQALNRLKEIINLERSK